MRYMEKELGDLASLHKSLNARYIDIIGISYICIDRYTVLPIISFEVRLKV